MCVFQHELVHPSSLGFLEMVNKCQALLEMTPQIRKPTSVKILYCVFIEAKTPPARESVP